MRYPVVMRSLLVLCLVSCSLQAQLTPEQKRLNTASFEKVWTTIRDKHWEKKPGGLDWQAIHDEIPPENRQSRRWTGPRRDAGDARAAAADPFRDFSRGGLRRRRRG